MLLTKTDLRIRGTFPDMIVPFNYIHLSANEISKGYFMHYCLSKVRDMRLQNVQGYFMSADDAVFHFWHRLQLDEILYPKWVIRYRKPSAWWKTKFGRSAALRAVMLFTETYKDNCKVQKLWSLYKEGLLANSLITDAIGHVRGDNGWTLSDFFYVPQKRLDYLSDAIEIFYEARLFVELTMNKLLNTVPYNRLPRKNFTYIPNPGRRRWNEYYNSNHVMVHPIKINAFQEMNKRLRFCETVVHSFEKALLNCS